MIEDLKTYIREQYALAISDYRVARNEADRNEAQHSMHRLQELAACKIGFGFADELQDMHNKNKAGA